MSVPLFQRRFKTKHTPCPTISCPLIDTSKLNGGQSTGTLPPIQLPHYQPFLCGSARVCCALRREEESSYSTSFHPIFLGNFNITDQARQLPCLSWRTLGLRPPMPCHLRSRIRRPILRPLGGSVIFWLRGADSNRRPSGYEPNEMSKLLHPAIYRGVLLRQVTALQMFTLALFQGCRTQSIGEQLRTLASRLAIAAADKGVGVSGHLCPRACHPSNTGQGFYRPLPRRYVDCLFVSGTAPSGLTRTDGRQSADAITASGS